MHTLSVCLSTTQSYETKNRALSLSRIWKTLAKVCIWLTVSVRLEVHVAKCTDSSTLGWRLPTYNLSLKICLGWLSIFVWESETSVTAGKWRWSSRVVVVCVDWESRSSRVTALVELVIIEDERWWWITIEFLWWSHVDLMWTRVVGINGVVVTWVVAIRVWNSTRRGFDSLLMHFWSTMCFFPTSEITFNETRCPPRFSLQFVFNSCQTIQNIYQVCATCTG